MLRQGQHRLAVLELAAARGACDLVPGGLAAEITAAHTTRIIEQAEPSQAVGGLAATLPPSCSPTCGTWTLSWPGSRTRLTPTGLGEEGGLLLAASQSLRALAMPVHCWPRPDTERRTWSTPADDCAQCRRSGRVDGPGSPAGYSTRGIVMGPWWGC